MKRIVLGALLGGLAVLVLSAAGALCGCSHEATAPHPAEPPLGPQPVTYDRVRNGTYPATHLPAGTVTLAEGRFEDPKASVKIQLGQVAEGDLDADGVNDAAVVLVSETGGSGVFEDLIAVRRRGDRLIMSEPHFLGDRVKIAGLSIDPGGVHVEMTEHGPDDPLCCPTVEVRRSFTLRDGLLAETKEAS
jgi:hypothetical protein